MERVRPILRWAGSKRQLLPVLASYWSDTYARYVEPFAGSCSLFFRVTPPDAVLADKNKELIETYEILREAPRDLHTAVSSWPVNEQVYREVRAIRPETLDRLRRAARFIYLNRNCFNGIYRTNRKGEFNVPFAGSRQGAVPSVEEFERAASLLQTVTLRAWDFGTTLRHCRAGDFVYLDPPFFVRSRRVFREYGPRTFGPKDLARLATHLKHLNCRGVHFLLSYADSREAQILANPWRYERLEVRRNVSGFVGSRRKSFELLITNIPE